eukprot:CAMPEP_0197434810 /NCGR_PEP_ID=MMETSP1175-20131217/2497_1 /TAXON_ID=1003142 /ORGANISM="Triceratium dubium, Strain CCMP147" /LENGTH=195 /DNA_ID=CAMNT_0042963665 /DNA_START=225 /DNA_END=812 /DNA_ORIENTATION=-
MIDPIAPVPLVEDPAQGGEVSPRQLLWSGEASYHWLTWAVASVGPSVPLLCLWVVLSDDGAGERMEAAVALAVTTAFILVVYAAVFPRKYEVWRPAVALDRLHEVGADVKVVTFLVSWKFTGCVRATHVPGWCGIEGHSLLKGLLKFATDPESRVLIRRRCGIFDVVISPSDPAAFIEAVWHASSLGGNYIESTQ